MAASNFCERTRASFVAALEARGISVPAAGEYVRQGMDPDYVREWPTASSDWAGQLIGEARQGYNPLTPAEEEELETAVQAFGLPGAPDWFRIYGQETEVREPVTTAPGRSSDRW